MKSSPFYFAFLVILSVLSCKKQQDFSSKEYDTMQKEDCNCMIEEAKPEISGEIVKFGNKNKSISLVKKDGTHILEGDILLTPEQVSHIKNQYENGTTVQTAFILNKAWTNGVVYYTIDPSLPNQSRVLNAISYWASHTPLQFVQRTNQPNYIRFVNGTGCSSNIGMIGSEQLITLDNGCSTGNVMHEIGHAIGLFHEQARKDRDSYITIHYENIQSGKENNFNTYYYSGKELGSLDFNSIMLYDSFAFSKNGQPTITKKDNSTFLSQRSYLSAADLEGVKYLYLGNPNGLPYATIEFENISPSTSQPNPFFYEYADYYIAFYTTRFFQTPTIPNPEIVFHYQSVLVYRNYFTGGLLNGGSPIYGTVQNTNGASRIFLGRYPFRGESDPMDDPQWGIYIDEYSNDFLVDPGIGYNIQ
ncbi:M12 family metallopeptidase [Arcticibacter tournemirensis]|uniref:Peptidase M12 n=1 Tax=Arcticibacter tournemirensis TaxID=699437 RepID=A0A4Q0MDJ8_9SPHI|nr:M12 family metallopeptidase [Arcticibacter tournemirensis]RXF70999.1 peptidase M12 [Arcticibacter tournemirensis]